MLRTGILNPALLSLLARVRHTNALVVAERGFPFWPELKRSTALWLTMFQLRQVICAIREKFVVGETYTAEEFLGKYGREARVAFGREILGVQVRYEPHMDIKKRVPGAIRLIRTGDSIHFANVILVSG